MSSVAQIDSARTPLSYARRYARMGWHVIPLWWAEPTDGGKWRCACGSVACTAPAKHPISAAARQGQNSATTDEAQIERWWSQYPRANVGIVLALSNLVAIDIDPRNGGDITIEEVEVRHGPLRSDVLQLTGGGGEHRVFQVPAGVMIQVPGKLGPGVDVKHNGYIVVEPSNHICGGTYQWEASSDPLDGVLPSVLPDWVRSVRPEHLPQEPQAKVLSATEVLELQSALAVIDPDARGTWLNVGMALHATDAGPQAYGLWCDWSRQSEKFDPVDQQRVWRSFRNKGLSGLSPAWIFSTAQAAGWVNPRSRAAQQFASVPLEEVRVAPPPAADRSQDADPGPVPGMGRVIVDWIDATSRKPQPQFAIQAALAFASTVLGRRVVTDRRNWPSLYFLNIGKSASGKEHAKWAAERLLEACGAERLIGPSGYTSDSGVLSALIRQPAHLTVIDEFGKVLEAASVKQNARAQSAMRALMEAWGRCDGVMRPQGFSTFGMSSKEADDMAAKTVRNPALTLLAMTTPDAFYNTIGTAAARDGFLNRFLIVESDIGRQVGQEPARLDVPQMVIEWAADQLVATGPLNPALSPTMDAAPRVLPFSESAARLLAAFERDCVVAMDELDDAGLAEMWGRSCEMSMRLALIIACLEQASSIGADAAAWAIQYIRHHAERAVHSLRTKVADSDFQRASKQILQVILRAGARGVTVRDLCKASRLFDASKPRERDDMLAGLSQAGLATLAEIPSESGRGKKRMAWVPTTQDENE